MLNRVPPRTRISLAVLCAACLVLALAVASPSAMYAPAKVAAAQQSTPEATEAPPEGADADATESAADGPATQFIFYSDRGGSDDIFLRAPDGTELPVVDSPANEREPTCSPDGRTVVYTSDATGNFQLYALRFGEREPVQLTASEGMNFAPIFSPDGRTIAFVSTRNEGVPTIWLIDADGGNPRQLTTGLGRDTSPSWGPEGQQLLFSTDQEGTWDLFLTIVEGEAEGEFPLLPPDLSDGNEIWPVFDPLGERIAYSSWTDLNDPGTSSLFLLDFELPEPRMLRAEPGADVAWSWADEAHLLASVGEGPDVPVVLLNVETGEITPLTSAVGFNGGARPCRVDPALLTGEATPEPADTATPEPVGTEEITTEDGAVGRNVGEDQPAQEAAPEPLVLSPALIAAAGARHVVQPGENLIKIGGRYGTTWADLAVLNALPNPDRLSVGQSLIVPVNRPVYPISGPQPFDYARDGPLRPPKQIVVRLNEQRVYAYENGRLVRSVLASTGLPATPTVTGEYAVYHKVPSQTMSGPGYYLPGVPYVMYFYEGYGLHGTYWHNNFGQPMSHGCVNLPTPEAEWFYNWAEIGTPVIVQS